eukprot:Clim_evm41s241 gene=Clim_evmTU41s241
MNHHNHHHSHATGMHSHHAHAHATAMHHHHGSTLHHRRNGYYSQQTDVRLCVQILNTMLIGNIPPANYDNAKVTQTILESRPTSAKITPLWNLEGTFAKVFPKDMLDSLVSPLFYSYMIDGLNVHLSAFYQYHDQIRIYKTGRLLPLILSCGLFLPCVYGVGVKMDNTVLVMRSAIFAYLNAINNFLAPVGVKVTLTFVEVPESEVDKLDSVRKLMKNGEKNITHHLVLELVQPTSDPVSVHTFSDQAIMQMQITEMERLMVYDMRMNPAQLLVLQQTMASMRNRALAVSPNAGTSANVTVPGTNTGQMQPQPSSLPSYTAQAQPQLIDVPPPYMGPNASNAADATPPEAKGK